MAAEPQRSVPHVDGKYECASPPLECGPLLLASLGVELNVFQHPSQFHDGKIQDWHCKIKFPKPSRVPVLSQPTKSNSNGVTCFCKWGHIKKTMLTSTRFLLLVLSLTKTENPKETQRPFSERLMDGHFNHLLHMLLYLPGGCHNLGHMYHFFLQGQDQVHIWPNKTRLAPYLTCCGLAHAETSGWQLPDFTRNQPETYKFWGNGHHFQYLRLPK